MNPITIAVIARDVHDKDRHANCLRSAYNAGFNAGVSKAFENLSRSFCPTLPRPINVIFNKPATIVYWDDGTKTVVKCQPGDTFNHESGLMAAMLKRFFGNDNTYNKVLNQWLPNNNK